jgi:hypothetical protein
MVDNASSIDPTILAELRPGEPVLWWGRPDPKRRILHKASRTSLILIGLMSILVLLLIGFDGLVVLSGVAGESFIVLSLLVVNVALLWSIGYVGSIWMKSRAHLRNLRQTIYAITNQRVLVITIMPGKSRGVASYTKSDIGTISRYEGKDGWGDLVFGTPRPSIVNGRRMMASASLAGIPQVRLAEAVLFQTFKSDDRAAPVSSAGSEVSQGQGE